MAVSFIVKVAIIGGGSVPTCFFRRGEISGEEELSRLSFSTPIAEPSFKQH